MGFKKKKTYTAIEEKEEYEEEDEDYKEENNYTEKYEEEDFDNDADDLEEYEKKNTDGANIVAMRHRNMRVMTLTNLKRIRIWKR